MCERNGWEAVHLFREEGESAKTADRPQLQDLLTYCRKEKPRPNYVVVHHIDRWARNGQDHDMMRNYLLKLSVKLRSFSQRLGESRYDEFYERIMSGQSDLDNKLRGIRGLAGMKTRVQGGRWTFRAPLGYLNGVNGAGNKTLLKDPSRAQLGIALLLNRNSAYSRCFSPRGWIIKTGFIELRKLAFSSRA
jgi:site-specific DNA recombinase